MKKNNKMMPFLFYSEDTNDSVWCCRLIGWLTPAPKGASQHLNPLICCETAFQQSRRGKSVPGIHSLTFTSSYLSLVLVIYTSTSCHRLWKFSAGDQCHCTAFSSVSKPRRTPECRLMDIWTSRGEVNVYPNNPLNQMD